MTEPSRHTFTRVVPALALAVAATLLALTASPAAAYRGSNGAIAFTRESGGNWDIYSTIDVGSGANLKRLTTSPAMDSEPAWSPGGDRIAFSVVDQQGFSNVYVMRPDGSDQTNLTNADQANPSDNTKPTWSPDGSRIAFQHMEPHGNWEIWTMKSDGSDRRLLTPAIDAAGADTSDYAPAWSPKGDEIAFTRSSPAGQDIYVVPATGGTPVNLTNAPLDNNVYPSWEPNGNRIAFVTSREPTGNATNVNQEIYVMDADGQNPQRRTNISAADFAPAWSPDGKQIAFMSNRTGNWQIYVLDDANADSVRQVTTGPDDDRYPDWQPISGGSAHITVTNVLRPSTDPGLFDLMVDFPTAAHPIVKSQAGNGGGGFSDVAPGVHTVSEAGSEAASATTLLGDYATTISCRKNGSPDASGTGPSLDVAVAFGDGEECTITNTRGAPTDEGSGITVSPPDVTTGGSPVTITFADVILAGVTTVTTSASGPAPPANFELSGSYYYLDTTATFTHAEVCFPYTGSPPSIVHWVAGSPQIEPYSREPDGSEVCADVTSFSPFVLAQPVTSTDVDPPQVVCGSSDGVWHADNVSIDCTAQDSGSGLADPADAAFALSTAVSPGTEDANASTSSRQVCDVAGNCATAGPISGNKIDRKAPGLSLPADMTVDATSQLGTTVSFSASASDGADPSPSVTCSPPSGSTFAIGAHTDACTAVDQAGNATHGSFTVTVRGPKEQLNRLIQDVIAASKLPAGVRTPLVTQLQTAVAQFDPSKPAERKFVCNALTAFATLVRLASGHGIPPSQASQWITDANRIRAVIGC